MRDLTLEEVNAVIMCIDFAIDGKIGTWDESFLSKLLELFEMEQLLLKEPRGRRGPVSKGRKE